MINTLLRLRMLLALMLASLVKTRLYKIVKTTWDLISSVNPDEIITRQDNQRARMIFLQHSIRIC